MRKGEKLDKCEHGIAATRECVLCEVKETAHVVEIAKELLDIALKKHRKAILKIPTNSA